MVEAYLSIGLVGEAKAAAAVLGHNYPDSEWYEDSYKLMKKYGGI
jgi:outer membrane protein assembly factor BamD